MNITLDDPRLTAYSLDELDEAGRSLIESEMQNFGECRREVEELSRVSALVRAGLAAEPAPTLLPTQQRAIESKLSRAGSKLSWIPLTKNWFLKTAVAAAAVLLICMVRIPAAVQPALGILQDASANTAYAMMHLTDVYVTKNESSLMVRDAAGNGINFITDGTCYSISWGLIFLVTSLLLGNLYLRSPWKRLLLTLFVIPLEIVRDGFRIFTIAELCVHTSVKTVVDSPLFRYNSWIFLALSLIPLFFFFGVAAEVGVKIFSFSLNRGNGTRLMLRPPTATRCNPVQLSLHMSNL